MIGPDQDLSDFPVWAWPYIDIARLARGDVRSVAQSAAGAATPAFAIATRLGTLIAAATIKQVASRIKDERLRSELIAAATATLAADGDDGICPPQHKWPWPHPPRSLELLELAGYVALAAAATGDKVLGQELGQVADKLAAQAREK